MLFEYLEELGSVFYSSYEILKFSDIYLFGFNLGGVNGKLVE